MARIFLKRLQLSLLFTFIVAFSADAQERILSFDSRVNVQADGSFLVTETIEVRAEGNRIRRGIFRDFPTVFEDASGKKRRVGFELLSAKRDGETEQSRIEPAKRALRIYLGNKDVLLQPGIYTYEIRYRTDRQLRLFDERAEVYWNATGHFWSFPIEQATATVDLPEGATAQDVTFFTGAFGERGKKANKSIFSGGNIVRVTTSASLGAREGLTIAVSFDKTFVNATSSTTQWRWFLRDYGAGLLVIGAALIAFFYYLWVWNSIGRDPPAGIMVPRWDIPEDVSPGLVNYIDNKGLEGKGFDAISAALLNLAVKGHVTLETAGKAIEIKALSDALPGNLPAGERAVLSRVLSAGGAITCNTSNGKQVKALVDSFGRAMNGEHRSVFYKSNYLYVIPGIAVSVAALILAFFFSSNGLANPEVLIPFVLFGGMGAFFALDFAKRMRSGTLRQKIGSVLSVFVLIIIFNGAASALISALPALASDPLTIAGAASLLAVNVLFFVLMGAPTPLGRKRMDEIAGLKRYLTVAEADRMNMQGAPKMSPRHYETLLPYAVALGVEKPWSNAFQTWLATAVAAGSAAAIGYHGPSWYHGSSPLDADSIGETMAGVGNDIASSLTSSMPAPKSSSSGFGGGGFSGGGGGGGGGGGW